MKGKLYACEWLEGDDIGCPVIVSRTRALWVADAGLLFQWPLPKGTVQVTACSSFPPDGDTVRVAFLEDANVPYAVIQETRKYLKRQEHVHAQEAVVQQAIDRLTREAKMAEGRLQTALTKAGIRQP